MPPHSLSPCLHNHAPEHLHPHSSLLTINHTGSHPYDHPHLHSHSLCLYLHSLLLDPFAPARIHTRAPTRPHSHSLCSAKYTQIEGEWMTPSLSRLAVADHMPAGRTATGILLLEGAEPYWVVKIDSSSCSTSSAGGG